MEQLVSSVPVQRFVSTEESELRTHCSFHPQTNPSSLKSIYSNPSQVLLSIQQETKRKDLAVAEMAKEQLVKQQKECTFKPQLGKYRPTKGSATVRGFEQFMDLRKQAKAKLEAHEAREAEVFGLHTSPSKLVDI